MTDWRSGRSRPLIPLLVFGIVALGLVALLVWGFTERRGEATAEAQREQAIRPDIKISHRPTGNSAITLSQDLRKEADIQTSSPETREYQPDIQAYGVVLDLQAFTELTNTIANAKAQLAIAEAKLTASQATFHRAQLLYKNGQNVSAAQLQSAEASYQADVAAKQAAQVQTQNASASAYQAWGPSLGQSLADGTSLAKDLVECKKVLIQITLPVGTSMENPPKSGSVETTTGQRVAIALVSPATRTDPQIQGMSFYYVADAASPALPGMTVIAYLPDGKARRGVAIPASAVVWLQGRAWIYLQTTSDTYVRREISTAQPLPGGGYVVAAADPAEAPSSAPQQIAFKDPIVVRGAQALLSQEFSSQIDLGGD